MTPQERIKEIIKINTSNLNPQAKILKLEEFVKQEKETEEQEKNKVSTNKVEIINPLKIEGVDIVTLKGEKGDSPTDEQIITLIKPLIPQPIKGDKGDPGKDGKSIKGPKGDRGESGYTPIKDIDYFDGQDGKDAESLDIQAIVKEVLKKLKVPKSSDKLHIKNIEGVTELQDKIVNHAVTQARGLLYAGLLDDNVVLHAGSNVTIVKNADGSYTISSTGGGGSSNTFVNDEVASGSGTSFTIASTPTSGTVHVYALGQRLKLTADYSISGTAITTINSWSAGDILVDYMTSQASAIFADNEVVSGSSTSFTLASSPTSGTEHLYALGQRLELTTDYSITGAAITTVNSWSSGDLIADYVTSAVSGNVDSEVVSGSSTTFTLANTPIAGSVQIYALGQRLTPTNDYTISGSTITTINTWSSGDILADYRK